MLILVNQAVFLFIFFCKGHFFPVDIDLKWYLKSDPQSSNTFSVTVDAGKVSRYIQLSDLRFIIDTRNTQGRLLRRDTMAFLESQPGESPYYLSGSNVAVKTFTKPHGPDTAVTGIKLLYKWYDTSMSTDPDPFGEKVIIEEMIYGEGSAVLSDMPDK